MTATGVDNFFFAQNNVADTIRGHINDVVSADPVDRVTLT
jgi:hypothetical protein